MTSVSAKHAALTTCTTLMDQASTIVTTEPDPYRLGFEIVYADNTRTRLDDMWGYTVRRPVEFDYDQEVMDRIMEIATANPTNQGHKRLSPKRVKKRRAKNKAARQSRKRQRR